MIFDELKVNNRIQIECENENPALRNIRGIVLGFASNSILIITDYGKVIEIPENKVLSITKITFDRIVSDALLELKNHYNEIYELELKLKTLKEKEPELINKLYDANFLSKFNIVGAKNRLDNSIPKELLHFDNNTLTYEVWFEANPDNQIEMYFKVFNTFEYYNLDEIGNVEKIIRIHAPDVKDVIAKSFHFGSKVEELEKEVVHVQDNSYSVFTKYRMKVEVTEDNFLEVREEIKKGLLRLRK